jgi:hypothetical protein
LGKVHFDGGEQPSSARSPRSSGKSSHASLQQVQEYIEEVEQERMADSAITKLVNASKTSE